MLAGRAGRVRNQARRLSYKVPTRLYANTRSFIFTGLSPNTTYFGIHIRACATDRCSPNMGSLVSVTTLPVALSIVCLRRSSELETTDVSPRHHLGWLASSTNSSLDNKLAQEVGATSGFVRSVSSSACVKTEAVAMLIRFGEELYGSLGLRQDSLFELVDAALTAPYRSRKPPNQSRRRSVPASPPLRLSRLQPLQLSQ
jgi:hypothetical protein